MEIILSGFADEAGGTIEEQMDVFEANGIRYIEMRWIGSQHVLDLTDEEIKALKAKLDARGFRVSAIGSPVGKSQITEDFSADLAMYRRAVAAAAILDCRYIRAFSFFLPEGANRAEHREEVAARLRTMVKLAEENGLVFALENESGIYTDKIDSCLEMLEEMSSKSFRLAFDPGNFVHNETRPLEAYNALKNYIAYFHIKDGIAGEEHFVACGEGEADMAALLGVAYRDGFDSFLSIEPHLGYLKDLSKAQQFTKAANALKLTLNQALGTAYEPVVL